MRSLKITLLLALGLLIAGGAPPGVGADAPDELSGDEILERAAQEGRFTQEGSQISRVRLDLLFEDGSTGAKEFAFFSRRDGEGNEFLLIYFLRPELECGTMLLSHDFAEPEKETRLWFFLSGLGQVKELVSEAERNASFAGSNFKNDQIGGGFDLYEDYRGALQGQEAVEVTWLGETTSRQAYRVTLEQRPEADVDFPTGTVWVDTEEFLVFRGEFNNAAGKLEERLTLDRFVEFTEDIVPNFLQLENVLDGSQSTLEILERRRPEAELPDAIFTPEALKSFNPEEFGVESVCAP